LGGLEAKIVNFCPHMISEHILIYCTPVLSHLNVFYDCVVFSVATGLATS
jgi:hypothetical protein